MFVKCIHRMELDREMGPGLFSKTVLVKRRNWLLDPPAQSTRHFSSRVRKLKFHVWLFTQSVSWPELCQQRLGATSLSIVISLSPESLGWKGNLKNITCSSYWRRLLCWEPPSNADSQKEKKKIAESPSGNLLAFISSMTPLPFCLALCREHGWTHGGGSKGRGSWKGSDRG